MTRKKMHHRRTQRLSCNLATVTFVPKLHPLAPTSLAPNARPHMNAIVKWYRQRLHDHEHCAWSDPALQKATRRCLRVKRMPRGRISIVFPVPADAHMDDVRVESVCIADPDEDGNHPLTLRKGRGKKGRTTVSSLVGSCRSTIRTTMTRGTES